MLYPTPHFLREKMSSTKRYYEDKAAKLGLDIELTDEVIEKIHESEIRRSDVQVVQGFEEQSAGSLCAF